MDLQFGLEIAIAAGTVMTTLTIGVKKIYRVARNVEEALSTIKRVQNQVEPNGGNSLHDKVNKLTADVKENKMIADNVKETIRSIHNRLDTLEHSALSHEGCQNYAPRGERNDNG